MTYHIISANVIENVSLADVRQSKLTGILKYLTEQQYQKFCNTIKYTLENNFENVTFSDYINLVIRTVKTNALSKHIRTHELSFSSKHLLNGKESFIDMTFEIFVEPESNAEVCDLLNYYITEFKEKQDEM